MASMEVPVGTSASAAPVSYIHQDHLGGTSVVTDSSGAVSELYDYYPYGEELRSEQLSSTTAHHTFTDKEFDDSAGLFYFEARWYNPSIGRFVSEDPMQYSYDPSGKGGLTSILGDPQSLNFYAYARDNPVNLTDPSGMFWQELKQYAAGIGNAWASNQVLGAGRETSNNSYFNAGQVLGDALSVVTGAIETLAGSTLTGTGAAGGLVLAPVSGGSSVVAGSATTAAGVAVATHGATVMMSGGSSFGKDVRSIADQIANGHAWNDHVGTGEFKGMFNGQDDFANYIENVMNNATEIKQLQDGRTGYWDDANQAVIIHNPNAKDQGTAFQPKDGKAYFDEQLH